MKNKIRFSNFKFQFVLPIFAVAFLFFASSCGVSYPKENIDEHLEELVKKETGLPSSAESVGKTLYLDMELEGLVSQDQDQLAKALKYMQAAVMSITRVVLSSDSQIKYMIVSSYDPGKNLVFRIVQNIDDIKGYFYMRISRADYESRNVFEIIGPDSAAAVLDDKRDISEAEYVGRMIVSSLSMAGRANPFFGAVMAAMHLKFADFKEGELVLSGLGGIDDKTSDFIKNILKEEAKKYSEKYNMKLTAVKITDPQGSIVLETSL